MMGVEAQEQIPHNEISFNASPYRLQDRKNGIKYLGVKTPVNPYFLGKEEGDDKRIKTNHNVSKLQRSWF